MSRSRCPIKPTKPLLVFSNRIEEIDFLISPHLDRTETFKQDNLERPLIQQGQSKVQVFDCQKG